MELKGKFNIIKGPTRAELTDALIDRESVSFEIEEDYGLFSLKISMVSIKRLTVEDDSALTIDGTWEGNTFRITKYNPNEKNKGTIKFKNRA